jgi:hypothetical protein
VLVEGSSSDRRWVRWDLDEMMEDLGRLEYERTGKTLAVAMSGRCAVEVLLSLLGDLVDVGVLVFGRHGDLLSV